MVPVKNRLKKKTDFERAIRKGSFFSFGNMTLRFAKNGLKKTRIGFLVRKKSKSRATSRNRIKRILRQAFGKYIEKMRPGYDIVVIYQPRKGENEKARLILEKAFFLLRQTKLIYRP